MSDNIQKDEVDVFVHDISSPLLIVNLAVEELEESIEGGEMQKERLEKLSKMMSKNLKRVNEMISNFRQKRREDREG